MILNLYLTILYLIEFQMQPIPIRPLFEDYSSPFVAQSSSSVRNFPSADLSEKSMQDNSIESSEDHLRCLSVLGQGGLVIKQKIDKLEALCGFEVENKYEVYLTGKDCVLLENQQPYFHMIEDSGCFQRQCYGRVRDFVMDVVTPDGTLALQFNHPFMCSCWNEKPPELQITNGSGKAIGIVKYNFYFCEDKFEIFNCENKPILFIRGDYCQCGKYCFCPFDNCSEVTYDIINPLTNCTGTIKKMQLSSCIESCTDVNQFSLSFPSDSTISHKALLLGAVILLDFLFFEYSQGQA